MHYSVLVAAALAVPVALAQDPIAPPPYTTTRPGTTTNRGTQTTWGQCNGSGWTGPTACVAGSFCTTYNYWYAQCIPTTTPTTTTTSSTTTTTTPYFTPTSSTTTCTGRPFTTCTSYTIPCGTSLYTTCRTYCTTTTWAGQVPTPHIVPRWEIDHEELAKRCQPPPTSSRPTTTSSRIQMH